MKLKMFLYDLLHFSDAAQDRLGAANYYFGNNYLSGPESHQLLAFPTPDGLNLLQSLEKMIKSKMWSLVATEIKLYVHLMAWRH